MNRRLCGFVVAGIAVAAGGASRAPANAAFSATTTNPTPIRAATITPPSTIAATALRNPTRITVTWTPPPAVNQGLGTVVYRQDPNGNLTFVTVNGGATASWTDSAVQRGNQYCYYAYTVAGQWTAFPPLSQNACATA